MSNLLHHLHYEAALLLYLSQKRDLRSGEELGGEWVCQETMGLQT